VSSSPFRRDRICRWRKWPAQAPRSLDLQTHLIEDLKAYRVTSLGDEIMQVKAALQDRRRSRVPTGIARSQS
jgi:hypothetical protein